MAVLQDIIEGMLAEITDFEKLSQAVAARYEALFHNLRRRLDHVLARTPDNALAVRQATIIADAAAHQIDQAMPGDMAVACRAGCNHCCNALVMVPRGTGAVIAEYLTQTMDDVGLAALHADLSEAATARAAAPEPFLLRRPCPLLDDTGHCRVYPVRPLSCRAFTSSSVASCEAAFDARDLPGSSADYVAQNPARFRLYAEASTALDRRATNNSPGAPPQTELAAAILAELPCPADGEQHTDAQICTG